ncbi:GD25280 [Drosophila simulans]|uniref:GD25280 n=1 Tax=Drosophila simulans TaxID=7240 RepID=B4QEN7_DROSI|nr:GD25280 [Drosophila simulans]
MRRHKEKKQKDEQPQRMCRRRCGCHPDARMPGLRFSGSQPRPEPSQDWRSNTTRFYGHPQARKPVRMFRL